MRVQLRRTVLALILLAISAFARSKHLQIYFIDAEGGQSTLVVSPSGEALLIDTGWAGEANAAKIMAAVRDAKIKKINYVLLTHYHRDHAGGVPDLVKQIPVNAFLDHGPNVEPPDGQTAGIFAAYKRALGSAQYAVLKPGDGVPVKGLKVQVLTAAGEHITSPLPGEGQANQYCVSEPPASAGRGENPQSIGTLITFGKFRFLDLGDLPGQKELNLVCPNNFIGSVDLFLATHHGDEDANLKSLVWAIHPRAIVVNNGATKGGSAEAWQRLHDAPGLQDLWQLHYATHAGKDHNSPEQLLANLDETTANYIKVTAQSDGTFTVLNSRNDLLRTYKK